MKRKYRYLIAVAALVMFNSSCTNLKEDLLGGKFIQDQAGGGSASLSGVYDQLNQAVAGGQGNRNGMQEHSTDELLGPTRGTDWDDFGTWRKLHLHTWDASHNQILDTWNQLNTGSYRATQVLAGSGISNQQKGEATFLRAWFMTEIMDLFGQVPQREASDSPDTNPKVMTRSAAYDFIETDLKAAISMLSSGTPANAGIASKEAAEALLARISLNKAVYKQDPKSPAGPFTFAAADMNQVIANCDAIIKTGAFTLMPPGSYYKNFYWKNATDSKEIIFRSNNKERGTVSTNIRWFTYMGNHYNQEPSGWNGFTTLSDFYNSFDAKDERRQTTIPGFTDVHGENFGFLIGQQYKGDGVTKIKDRSGNPLSFTPNVNLNASNESMGIRTLKYPLDPANTDNSMNDMVWLRYADILLMKAEAILRGGTATNGETAVSLVNKIRVARGLTALSTIDLPGLLTERAHEMYLEMVRRDDMIRFGTFNAPVGERPTASDASRVVFPIPSQALGSNPNLSQNFGY